MARDALSIDYASHPQMRRTIDILRYCAESISLEFDHWGERYARGPGLYFVIVSGHSVADFADPMGDNRWPVDECAQVTDDIDSLLGAASEVALANDGAVIVGADGTVLEQMVRLKDLGEAERPTPEDVEQIEYADWMGARHMSAVDTSIRDEVIAAVTLSEESGRVTVFEAGNYDDTPRDRLGDPWRGDE
ncbi:MAG: hypothetical protein ABEJ74_05025 [Haloferacaceae archaeon]